LGAKIAGRPVLEEGNGTLRGIEEEQMGAIAAEPEAAVLERFDQLARDRARLVDQIDQAEAKIGTLESERQILLPRVADGDKSASLHADLLDTGKVQMQRQIDGLRMKLGDMDRSIAEISGPRNEIFESYRERIGKHSHNQAAHWRAACRARFEASETIFESQTDPSLTERDRIELLSEASQAQNSQGGATWNEHWENARGSLGAWKQPIVASKPPDDKKHLEELK
jgi:small-conductance mechanosensitive channel